MAARNSKVTIHMAASLDGFIARPDGSTDWIETSDKFEGGEDPDPEFFQAVDCYLMGSRTYETALGFEAEGYGWPYGDKPVYVLTSRDLPKTHDTVEFISGDLAELINDWLRPNYSNIYVAGGGTLAGDMLERGLVDEVRYSILPVLIGEGIHFFEGMDSEVSLHLMEVKAYKSGVVALRHAVL